MELIRYDLHDPVSVSVHLSARLPSHQLTIAPDGAGTRIESDTATEAEVTSALSDYVPPDRPVELTPTELAAVRTQIQVLRSLRQMGRNDFMALSAAERDRLIYDALVAQTIIDLAILRDE